MSYGLHGITTHLASLLDGGGDLVHVEELDDAKPGKCRGERWEKKPEANVMADGAEGETMGGAESWGAVTKRRSRTPLHSIHSITAGAEGRRYDRAIDSS